MTLTSCVVLYHIELQYNLLYLWVYLLVLSLVELYEL